MAKINRIKLVDNLIVVDDVELARIEKLLVDTSQSFPRVRLSIELMKGVTGDEATTKKADIVATIYTQGLGFRLSGQEMISRKSFDLRIHANIGLKGINIDIEGKCGSIRIPPTQLSNAAELLKLISGVR